MYTGLLHTHRLVVILFLLIYLIKTVLLLSGNVARLDTFAQKTKVFEMIVSFLFLATGIALAMMAGDLGDWFWYKIMAVAAAIPLAVIGFKKKNKVLALLSLLLIVYAYGVAETRAPFFKQQPMEVASADSAGLGKSVYSAACVSCHGEDGKLGKSGAKDISMSMLSKEEKVQLIHKGKNGMPAFRHLLNDEQIEAVVGYLDSLKTN